LTNIFLVGAGGFIGSVLRYLIGGYFQGFVAQIGESRNMFSNEVRVFIFVGILGGFTTFSSFGNETINLMRGNQIINMFFNIGANVILGLLAVWLGRIVATWIWR
jgi:CrcB protein